MCRYRHTSYRKQTKNQWARDDPAFVVITCMLVAVAAIAYCITYCPLNPSCISSLALGVDCLRESVVVSDAHGISAVGARWSLYIFDRGSVLLLVGVSCCMSEACECCMRRVLHTICLRELLQDNVFLIPPPPLHLLLSINSCAFPCGWYSL